MDFSNNSKKQINNEIPSWCEIHGSLSVEKKVPYIIKVIAVGDGAGRAIEKVADSLSFTDDNTKVEYYWLSKYILPRESRNKCPIIPIKIGDKTTRGRCEGWRPEVGAACANESIEEIRSIIQNANLVIIIAGMGGGTGSGAAPVVAEEARLRGIPVVSIVSKPFGFERSNKNQIAVYGIERIEKYSDMLVIIPLSNYLSNKNDDLISFCNSALNDTVYSEYKKPTIVQVFDAADIVFYRAIQMIINMIDKY